MWQIILNLVWFVWSVTLLFLLWRIGRINIKHMHILEKALLSLTRAEKDNAD